MPKILFLLFFIVVFSSSIAKGEESNKGYKGYIDFALGDAYNLNAALCGCHFASNNYTSKKLYVTPDSIRDRECLKTYLTDIRLASRLRLQESMCV